MVWIPSVSYTWPSMTPPRIGCDSCFAAALVNALKALMVAPISSSIKNQVLDPLTSEVPTSNSVPSSARSMSLFLTVVMVVPSGSDRRKDWAWPTVMDPAGMEKTICEESSSSLTVSTRFFLPSNVDAYPEAPPMNKLEVCDVILCVRGTPVKAAAAVTSGRRRTGFMADEE